MNIRLARSISGSTGVSQVASEFTVKISVAASEDNATGTRGTVIGGSGNDDEISTTVDLLVDSKGTAIGGQGNEDEIATTEDLFNDSGETAIGGSGNEDAIPTTDDVTTGVTARDDVWLDMYLSITFLIAINTRPRP